jgi:hypothetical protein
MNKKFATLVFAIGLGVASAPAFASCQSACAVVYRTCIAAGEAMADCRAEQQECLAMTCGL